MSVTRRCLAAMLLIAVSCAKPAQSTDTAARPAQAKNVISNQELQDPVLLGMDALRAIRYLRPMFFRETGPLSFSNTTAGMVQFSMDFGPLQPLSHLATLPSLSLQSAYEIRYLDINDAQNRFGVNANGGPVIVVVNNKQ